MADRRYAPGGSRLQRPRPACGISATYLALVFLLLVLFRLLNAFVVQTFFQPDEYFQSLEPGWQLAFGANSGAWITWEWREGLRSSIHPMSLASVYRVGAWFANSLTKYPDLHAQILMTAPKVTQAVIAAIGDFFTWRLADVVYGPDNAAAYWTVALTALSPWQWFCSTRTFSNSLEMTLTVMALCFWPWEWSLAQGTSSPKAKAVPPKQPEDLDAKEMIGHFKSFLEGNNASGQNAGATHAASQSKNATAEKPPPQLYYSLVAAATACILRPPNIIIWAALVGTLLYRYGNLSKASALAQVSFLSGTSVLALSIGMDRAFYGRWVIPPLNFLYFNIVYAVAGFYGTNRIDYYFTEGMPLLLTTTLPFANLGIYQALRPGVDNPAFKGYQERQSRFVLATAVLVTVLAMTMIGHKEVRFVYPLLPIMHVLAAKPMASFFSTVSENKIKLALLMLMLTLNIYIAAYTTLVHQRGVIDVLHYLRHEQESRFTTVPPAYEDTRPFSERQVNVTVGFLMPCHSTPWRSHLVHPHIEAWALTCEPPLNLSFEQRMEYEDEADIFYNHPALWIDNNLKERKSISARQVDYANPRKGDENRRDWPEYLVFFEHLEPVMSMVLEDTRYKECWRGFNTHWHDDWRRRGDVVVWCDKRQRQEDGQAELAF